MAKASVESPLTTLVRRASSRRMKPPPSLGPIGRQQDESTPPSITVQYDDSQDFSRGDHYHHYQGNGNGNGFRPPNSPLLHGQFSRDSVATTSSYDNNSFLDSRPSSSANHYHQPHGSRVQSYSSSVYPGSELGYEDHHDHQHFEETRYGTPVEDMEHYGRSSSALRDSWMSTATDSTARGPVLQRLSEGGMGGYGASAAYGGVTQEPSGSSSSSSSVNHLSSERYTSQQWASIHDQYFSKDGGGLGHPSTSSSRSGAGGESMPVRHTVTAGRTPVVNPMAANFSRPVRPALLVDQVSEDRKRQVLLRNTMSRQRAQSSVSVGSGAGHGYEQGSPSTGASPGRGSVSTATATTSSSQYLSPEIPQYQPVMSRKSSNLSQTSGSNRSPSPQDSSPGSSTSRQPPHDQSPTSQGSSNNPSLSPQPPAMSRSYGGGTSQSPSSSKSLSNSSSPNHPSSSSSLAGTGMGTRAPSTLSVYSDYSYYAYENAAPSPTGSTFSNSGDPFAVKQQRPGASKMNQSTISSSSSSSSSPTPLKDHAAHNNNSTTTTTTTKNNNNKNNPKTAHDYLLLGIEHHEADRLNESARCFERSTVEGGGCGVGMLMWGLTLRHGWGCPKNEKAAFKWLQKAAESAVGDLEATRARGVKDNSVVRVSTCGVDCCRLVGWCVSGGLMSLVFLE